MTTSAVVHYAVNPPRTAREGGPMVVACGAEYEGLTSSGDLRLCTCDDCTAMIESGRLDAAKVSVDVWEDARKAVLQRLRWQLAVKVALYGLAAVVAVLVWLWVEVWR